MMFGESLCGSISETKAPKAVHYQKQIILTSSTEIDLIKLDISKLRILSSYFITTICKKYIFYEKWVWVVELNRNVIIEAKLL